MQRIDRSVPCRGKKKMKHEAIHAPIHTSCLPFSDRPEWAGDKAIYYYYSSAPLGTLTRGNEYPTVKTESNVVDGANLHIETKKDGE